MNEVRCKSLLAGQTVVAQKVYEVVPIECRWTDRAIYAEMVRAGISVHSLHVVQGCLGALVQAGLIAGDPINGYIRTHVKRKNEVKHQATATGSLNPTPAPATADPLEMLSSLASRLARTMSDLRAIGEELEVAALAISDQIEQHAGNTRKLEQLRSLFKDLS